METRIITTAEEFESLKQQWDALFINASDVHAFQSWDWITSWWNHFHEGKELFIITVQKGERILAIAPLMKVDGVVRFIADEDADYSTIPYNPNYPEALDLIIETLAKEPRLHLHEIPEESMTYKALLKKDVRVIDYLANERFSVSPARKLKQKTLRQQIRKLEAKGTLSLTRIEEKSEIPKYFDIFLEQHNALWNDRGESSIFQDEVFQNHMKQCMPELLTKHMFTFYALRFNDEILATNLGFNEKRRYLMYNGSFNQKYADFSPGRMILFMIMQEILPNGIEFDFTRGAEGYKDWIADTRRENRGIIIEKSLIRHLYALVRTSMRARLMKNPKLHEKLRRLKRR